jgi:hypothetical protein
MPPPTTVEPDTLEALREIEALGIADKAMRPDSKQLCERYAKMAPHLERIAPLLALIPTYGPAVAGALTILRGIADSLCPSTETPQP